jgi:hypothetical protein
MELDAVDFLEESTSVSVSDYPVVIDAPEPVQLPSRASAPRLDWREATVSVLLRVAPRRDLRGVVGVAMAACGLLIAVAGIRSTFAPTAGPATVAVRPAPSSAGVAAEARAAASPAPAPRPSAESTPWSTVDATRPSGFSGAVAIAAGVGPVFIDGVRATARTHAVTCGEHTLVVDAMAPRRVVVPCGGSVLVERGGKVSVR